MTLKLQTLFTIIALLSSTVTSTEDTHRAHCPDGNTATNPLCCPFYALRDDLQNNLYVFGIVRRQTYLYLCRRFKFECGEDAHEVLRLSFRTS